MIFEAVTRWLRNRKYSEHKIVQRVDLFFGHYYRILVILYELEQRCIGIYSFEISNREIKGSVKRLKQQLKKNNFEGLNKYSTSALLCTLQNMLKELPQPLLTGSSSLFRRWMEFGDYLMQAIEEGWDDIFPDLVIHLARFMAVHTKVYELLVLERLILVCQHLASNSKSSIEDNLKFCPETVDKLACLFAPCIFFRPRRFGLPPCKEQVGSENSLEKSIQIFLFLFYNINDIFSSDNEALLKKIPLALRKYWQPVDGGPHARFIFTEEDRKQK